MLTFYMFKNPHIDFFSFWIPVAVEIIVWYVDTGSYDDTFGPRDMQNVDRRSLRGSKTHLAFSKIILSFWG